MKLWLVYSAEDYGDTYVRSIWDSEEGALKEADRLKRQHEKEIESDTPDEMEPNYFLSFWASSAPYYLNDNGQ